MNKFRTRLCLQRLGFVSYHNSHIISICWLDMQLHRNSNALFNPSLVPNYGHSESILLDVKSMTQIHFHSTPTFRMRSIALRLIKCNLRRRKKTTKKHMNVYMLIVNSKLKRLLCESWRLRRGSLTICWSPKLLRWPRIEEFSAWSISKRILTGMWCWKSSYISHILLTKFQAHR